MMLNTSFSRQTKLARPVFSPPPACVEDHFCGCSIFPRADRGQRPASTSRQCEARQLVRLFDPSVEYNQISKPYRIASSSLGRLFTHPHRPKNASDRVLRGFGVKTGDIGKDLRLSPWDCLSLFHEKNLGDLGVIEPGQKQRSANPRSRNTFKANGGVRWFANGWSASTQDGQKKVPIHLTGAGQRRPSVSLI